MEYLKAANSPIAYYIIGHGNSISAKKGDSINKMSGWIKQILEKEKI